jgi:hypothetical protein
MVLRWVFVLHGRFDDVDFLFPLGLYGVVAALAWLIPDTWVAGGDGWLMLLRGRHPLAWVRTSRLVHVSVEPKHRSGDGSGEYEPYLTVRDSEGRELQTWLRKLPRDGAASLLEGIRRSSAAGLADVESAQASAAVAALGARAQVPSA